MYSTLLSIRIIGSLSMLSDLQLDWSLWILIFHLLIFFSTRSHIFWGMLILGQLPNRRIKNFTNFNLLNERHNHNVCTIEYSVSCSFYSFILQTQRKSEFVARKFACPVDIHCLKVAIFVYQGQLFLDFVIKIKLSKKPVASVYDYIVFGWRKKNTVGNFSF